MPATVRYGESLKSLWRDAVWSSAGNASDEFQIPPGWVPIALDPHPGWAAANVEFRIADPDGTRRLNWNGSVYTVSVPVDGLVSLDREAVRALRFGATCHVFASASQAAGTRLRVFLLAY